MSIGHACEQFVLFGALAKALNLIWSVNATKTKQMFGVQGQTVVNSLSHFVQMCKDYIRRDKFELSSIYSDIIKQLLNMKSIQFNLLIV